MINSTSSNEDPSIQESLLQLSTQLGHPLDRASVDRLYQNARDLLSHISSAPLTLARVAGTLLVYDIQTATEELHWFKAQIEQCLDEEDVEELIESIHRTDALWFDFDSIYCQCVVIISLAYFLSDWTIVCGSEVWMEL